MPSTITLRETVVTAKDQVTADLGGEIIILDLGSGEYFGLNEVGSKIWELITEPRAVAEVRDELVAAYPDVDPAQCEEDLLALLNEMHEASLIETVGVATR